MVDRIADGAGLLRKRVEAARPASPKTKDNTETVLSLPVLPRGCGRHEWR